MKIFQKIVAILLLFVEANFSIPSIVFFSAAANPKTTLGDDQAQVQNADRPARKQALKSPAPVPTPVPLPKVQRKSPGSLGINPSPVNKNPLATSAQISALTSLQLFSEPLYPTAAPRISDNNALILALNAYANNPSADNTQALENFIDANPNNPWTLSVQTNLGLLYAKGCYWSKALNTLDRVWNEGKNRSGYKNSVDMAVSKLAFVAARLGRVQYMQQLATSVGARILAPNAQDTYLRAKQSLQREVNHPEQGFLCGAQAVQATLTATKPSEIYTPAVGDVQSSQQGISLTTVANLANSVGLQMTPVEWTGDTVQIPTPAVIHWKSGHYAALVSRTEDGGYHLVDHTMELDTTVSAQAIQQEGSGYFLIPTASVTSDFTPLTQAQTDHIWGKGGAPPSTSPVPASVAPTADISSSNGQSCNSSGMATWAADKLRIALILKDTPIIYHPPVGPTIAFNLEYNHKNTSPSSTPFATYIGAKWTLNYSSYLVPNGSSVTQYGPGGGTLTYSNLNAQTGKYAPQYYTQNLLTKTGPYSYALTFANGGSYTFASPVTQGSSQYIFLTAITDPQGNSITFTYDAYHRLSAVTDASGGISTLTYQGNNPNVPATYYLVQSIMSPYGATASFAYDSSYELTSITDPVGITSQFTYITNPITNGDYIGTLTTPYGNTNFLLKQIGDDNYNDVALIITDPLGATREIETTDDLASTQPEPFPLTPLSYYPTYAVGTYEWDTQNYSATTPNYGKATKTKWLVPWVGGGSDQVPYYVRPILDNPIVYSYPGQTNAGVEGTSPLPSSVQTVLPDGSTQKYSYTYNAFGETTSATDPLGRTTTYGYATNGIDLLSVSQGGTPLFSANYNGIHLPIQITGADGQTTNLSYNLVGQITSITNPLSQTQTFTYNGSGFLTQISGPLSGASTSFTYDNADRVSSVTDSQGYTLNYAYDKLNRLTSVTYPDGSTDSIKYVNLDPSIYTDRQGRVTQVMYDKNRRLSVVIDPEVRFTQYLWCSCGALEEFVDPNGNFTSFIRDLQGRVLSEVYPDRSTKNISYDSVGRVASTSSLKGITTYAYYPDNQPKTISTAGLAPIQSTYDQTYGFLTNISQGSLSYAYSYNPVGMPGALKLSQVSAPNGSISFNYDALGRVSSWSTANGTESYQFNRGGRISQVQNPLGTFGLSYLGATGQIAQIVYPNQTSENYSYLPNNQDRRLSALAFMARDIYNWRSATVIIPDF